MTPPVVRENGQAPPGLLPRRAQWLVFGGIAGAVILASLFSGQRARNGAGPTSPPGPSISDVTALQKRLQIEQQALDEARKRAAEQSKTGTTGTTSSPITSGSPDSLEMERRALLAHAPFARSVVFIAEAHEAKVGNEAKTQIAIRVEEKSDTTKESREAVPKPVEPKLKESGQLLPMHEGNIYRLLQGTMIPAKLVYRLEGSFTGPVISRVSTPVLSTDKTALLIPAGSEFLGQARKVEEANQTRLAVTFSRLILPNGYTVDLDAAPGLDSQGESGIGGTVNNHNARKFSLTGAIGLLGGLALYAGQGGPFAGGVASTMGNSATSILSRSLNNLPTITVPEGHAVNVYLPKDLNIRAYQPLSGEERISK